MDKGLGRAFTATKWLYRISWVIVFGAWLFYINKVEFSWWEIALLGIVTFFLVASSLGMWHARRRYYELEKNS